MWIVTVLSAADVAMPQSDWVTLDIRPPAGDGRWLLESIDDTVGPDAAVRCTGRAVAAGALRRRARRVRTHRERDVVTSVGVIFAGFPNPIGWTIDKVTGFVGDAATEGFEMIIGGLTAWVVDAVVWVVGGVFNFFLDSTDPNVQADWFVTGDGPYATTATIGATLLVGLRPRRHHAGRSRR